MMKILKAALLCALVLAAPAAYSQSTCSQVVASPACGGSGGGGGSGDGTLVDVEAGDGIEAAVAGDTATVSVDRGVVPFKGAGTADPPATCGDTGDDFQLYDTYRETDTSETYLCTAVDTWVVLGTSAADSVVVAGAAKTIPDCDDSGGNHLNYDTATDTYSCGTSGSGSTSYTQTTLVIDEEFCGGGIASGSIGQYGWSYFDVGTGGGGFLTNVEAGHPCVYRINSDGSGDNGGRSIYPEQPFSMTDLGEDFDLRVIFRHPISAVANSFVSIGFQAGDEGSVSSAIRMLIDADRSHTNYIYQMCDSSTAGCASNGDDTNADTVDSGVAGSTSWGTFTLSHRNAGSCAGASTWTFTIAGGSAKTFCASGGDEDLGNLPTADLKIVFTYLNRDTGTQRYLYIDRANLEITGLGR